MTFNVVKDLEDGRSWKIGILAGLSNTKKILPFALILSTTLTQERYSQMLKALFDIMGKASKVIISDE